MANAVKDGFFEPHEDDRPVSIIYTDSETGDDEHFPMYYAYYVTGKGKDFVRRYAAGEELA